MNQLPMVKLDNIKAEVPYACVGGPFGSNLTSKHYVDTGVPVIRGQNLNGSDWFEEGEFVYVTEEKANQLKSNLAYRGDLVFTQRGTLGQVGLIPQNSKYERYVVSQSQMKLTVDPERVDARYVYHYFRLPSTVEQILNRTITAGVPHINLGILKSFVIPLPNLSEQIAIANFAQNYDELIRINQRRIQLLEEAARKLYREWFVKLRFPGYESVEVKDDVPKAWAKIPLGDLANIVMGQSPESKYYNKDEEGLPFHQGVSDFGDRFIIHSTYTTQSSRIAEAGDILCSVRAPVGRLNLTRDKIAIGRGLSAMRSKTNHQSLLFYQLKALFVEEDMIGGGAIFASVGKKELFGQQLLQPSEPIASEFNRVAGEIDEQIEILEMQNRSLSRCRDLLLPKLMSGQLDVSAIALPDEVAA